ncbi:MAG: citrate synthase [Crenarchaeota archaeon 13_1_40CM_2_52_14]|nr:MAG: citrate synthase [Crenarchaeota archaeon 13_1_40CM_3_52_17]OLD34933.1 MAG: citrate synthase [Crenarchaeota archaeon 13_1_40CM_2_52_14]OLE70320.1 MAG: citrate synthase [archaeon 13_1_20CM_2_51_12]
MVRLITTEIEKGLEGVVIAKSSITFIDGQQGILRYRGIDINELAAKSDFEEVTYLLWNGKLPNKAQFSEFKRQLTVHRPLPTEVLKLLRGIPKGAIPMEVARTAVSYMATFPRKKGETFDQFNRRESLQLTSTLPTIVASYERIRKGKTPIRPDPRLGHAANFLYGLSGKKPDEVSRSAFDTLSVLYADHEMNASTFAAVVAISTLADLGGAVTSAIATLAGPLHGGSNQRVMEMLEEIGTMEKVEGYVDSELAAGRRIMGFGHRIYRTYDPRARILKNIAEQLAEERGGSRKWLDIAEEVERMVMDKRKLWPNIEFYAAVVLNALGVPKDLMPAVFACNRVSGWIAHIYEQYADNRLIRPLTEYVGPAQTPYVPIEQRT